MDLDIFRRGKGILDFFLPGEGCGVWALFIQNGYFTMKILFNFHLGAGGGGHLTPHKISARNSNYNEPYEA